LTELRRPESLDAGRYDRSDFDSGQPGLDECLRRYAGQNRRRDTAATWVIADAHGRLVAYASLAMTAIERCAAPGPVAKRVPDPVPALLLGRRGRPDEQRPAPRDGRHRSDAAAHGVAA